MKRTIIPIIIVLILPNILFNPIKSEQTSVTILVVDDDYTMLTSGSMIDHFNSIQDAIDHANTGDTIYVHSGIYYENITINKSLSLVGENESNTIIDACEVGHVVYIKANYVFFRGFNVDYSNVLLLVSMI